MDRLNSSLASATNAATTISTTTGAVVALGKSGSRPIRSTSSRPIRLTSRGHISHAPIRPSAPPPCQSTRLTVDASSPAEHSIPTCGALSHSSSTVNTIDNFRQTGVADTIIASSTCLVAGHEVARTEGTASISGSRPPAKSMDEMSMPRAMGLLSTAVAGSARPARPLGTTALRARAAGGFNSTIQRRSNADKAQTQTVNTHQLKSPEEGNLAASGSTSQPVEVDRLKGPAKPAARAQKGMNNRETDVVEQSLGVISHTILLART
ncbi:unnamed protein product [Protopolystoma xenopodis]|uniref:Uncharacterized protein n=1 Tax=Protopolystoma xenopodis TaxID=117903 RepID=A0A3S5CSJ1_9PLAT|nr:unnamed protein product [Protopolystoma xenopodis]